MGEIKREPEQEPKENDEWAEYHRLMGSDSISAPENIDLGKIIEKNAAIADKTKNSLQAQRKTIEKKFQELKELQKKRELTEEETKWIDDMLLGPFSKYLKKKITKK